MPAAEVAGWFGYSTASVHQRATLLRTGRLNLFTDPRPGPKGPRKATGELRARVLALRAAGHSVTEIAGALTADGLPFSPQPAWTRSRAAKLPAGRLARCPCRAITPGCCYSPPWPELGLPALVRAAGYPATRQLSPWRSVGSLLLAKCARKGSDPPRRLARRRCGQGVHPRADRPAQGHPPGHLLLAGPPRLQPQTQLPHRESRLTTVASTTAHPDRRVQCGRQWQPPAGCVNFFQDHASELPGSGMAERKRAAVSAAGRRRPVDARIVSAHNDGNPLSVANAVAQEL